ncbi:small mechanosensitive ion channel protein MscS [Ignicoccus islandicus DSM 13165]|uniref:Small mechanosensitive ion channel protein MscS n=1 Tax=Ignicoccus islandicus DSM 13165 TaxID=940295 RepID=A0A0U2VCS4_9CREN|nr:mechanosensitive ion channel family protein [Ignicoccus islandicus]ALU11874.1 small mechanosensitive ion channel protein MscS [Ignicoccus islandicus DSM 13165]
MTLFEVLFGIALIVSTKIYLSKKILEILAKYSPSEDLTYMGQWISTLFLYLFGALMVVKGFGFSISDLLVAGGFITLAISFAAQTVISNAISGIFLVMEKPIRIGDFVYLKEAGISGAVKSISILSTTIRLWNGELARVPNSKFFEDVIVNQSMPIVRRLEVKVGVPYDLEKVKTAIDVIKRAMNNSKYVLKVPEPEVFVEEFGDSAVIIRVNAWVPSKKWYECYKQVRYTIYEELVKAGVEVPFTTITVIIDRKS